MKYWNHFRQQIKFSHSCSIIRLPEMMVWHNLLSKLEAKFAINRGIIRLGDVLVTNQGLSEPQREKTSPNLQRKVSLVKCIATIYYAVITSFVSSGSWLLSISMNRQLIVAGIHIHQGYTFMSAIEFIEYCLYEHLMQYHKSLVGMEAPVAYYNNKHLLIQYVQKQNYKIASVHSRTL